MTKNYVPLRVNRDFGDIINTYFDFFKRNIKKFTNVFISYNGIFLIGLLVASYLMVSGILGLIEIENNFGIETANEEDFYIPMAIGGGLFFLIFLMVGALNYGLSTSYMVLYDNDPTESFEKKDVWAYTKSHMGSIILFILLLFVIYIGFLIVSIFFLIIPIVGSLAQYVLQFFISAWVGVSFFEMLQNKKSVGAALSEGWNLVKNNFWRSVGVNFVMGLLLFILLMLMMTVPGVLFGIYTFHVVENSVSLTSNVVATVIYTICLTLALIVLIYGQCLTQFVNGILYYTLHEKTYNINTRKRIAQIGEDLNNA
jgi:hypothetical protein